jgi:putative aldouronate transport system permease protein
MVMLKRLKRLKKIELFDVINVSLLALLMGIIIYPLYFTVIASFSDPYALMKGEVIFLPRGFTHEAYFNVLRNKEIWTGYFNTILYAVFGTLYALAVTIPAAYVLSRKRLKGRNLVMAYFVFTMYFSGGLVPYYVLVKNLGLLNTRLALILPAGLSVYHVIIARTFYQSSIPEELFESARIDGANDYRVFFSIVLPLSGSIIAVIALYLLVGHWNSYFQALLFITDSRKYPLQLILRNILIMNQNFSVIAFSGMSTEQLEAGMKRSMMAETMKYALIFISSLPVLVAYPFVQKHFVKGVMIGALKG